MSDRKDGADHRTVTIVATVSVPWKHAGQTYTLQQIRSDAEELLLGQIIDAEESGLRVESVVKVDVSRVPAGKTMTLDEAVARCPSIGPKPDRFRCGLIVGHSDVLHTALVASGASWVGPRNELVYVPRRRHVDGQHTSRCTTGGCHD